jgi:hypothetical protein
MSETDNPTQPNSTDNPDAVNPSADEGKSVIEETKEMLEENKKILTAITDERKKIEKAAAEVLVSGRSYAGQPAKKQETAEEKADREWKESAKERYKGTGLDPT